MRTTPTPRQRYSLALPLELRPGDLQPLYRQIARRSSDTSAERQWRPGDQLPLHRDVAAPRVVPPRARRRASQQSTPEGLCQTRERGGRRRAPTGADEPTARLVESRAREAKREPRP